MGNTINNYVTPLAIKTVLCALFLIASIDVAGHNFGKIEGMITDSQTRESMPGVNIVIVNTIMGVTSDLHGRFAFNELHPGKYLLRFSCMGYQTVEWEAEVFANKTTENNIQLTPGIITIDAYSVVVDRPYSAASLKYIRSLDLGTRPVKSSQDLLKLVPGLITAQHAGGGKAEQLFLRGFDADHGTDVNISVDGMPVNMVSHGHGHGYADLHFLIPEVVQELQVYKGPYFASYGNLATAGAITLSTCDHLDQNLVKIEGGAFNTVKTTLLLQPGKGGAEQNAWIGIQYYQTDGPTESPANLMRANVIGKYFVNISHNSKLTISAGAFSSAWDASGQIPVRAVEDGSISRYGAIDNLEGGITSRTNLNLTFEQKHRNSGDIKIQAYFTSYDFKLFSNFTFYLDDQENGDMIEQLDNRFLSGINSTYNWNLKMNNGFIRNTAGAGIRADNIQLGLWHSPDRMRMQPFSLADINERNLYAWFTSSLIFSEKLRLQLGLRADYLTFNVNDHLEVNPIGQSNNLPHVSGYTGQGMLNPKINLTYSPGRVLDIYLNAGSGFHSNDARQVIFAQRVKSLISKGQSEGLSDDQIANELLEENLNPGMVTSVLPRALGMETGIRLKQIKNLNVAVALWYMHLEKEFVFVGDGGYSELSNPTLRTGLDIEARYKILWWLWLDLDLCLSDGRVEGEEQGKNYIPLAPRFTATGGCSMKGFHNFEGSLRFVYVGDRPANEDNSVIALGYTLVNLGLAYNLNQLTISCTIENLLNQDWNEAQFDTESRLAWENEAVSEIHFTPGNPLNFQWGVSYRF